MTHHPKTHVTINTPIQFRDELPDKVDVAIIGAGVVGVFTALYLSTMGKSVIVIEKARGLRAILAKLGVDTSTRTGCIRITHYDARE